VRSATRGFKASSRYRASRAQFRPCMGGVAEFEGRDVIRICATHGETTERDVEILAEVLDEAAKI